MNQQIFAENLLWSHCWGLCCEGCIQSFIQQINIGGLLCSRCCSGCWVQEYKISSFKEFTVIETQTTRGRRNLRDHVVHCPQFTVKEAVVQEC